MRFDEVERLLQSARAAPLPGHVAQSIMAPRPRRLWVPGALPADAKKAAGLVLLYPRGADTMLLLTVRSAHVAHHQGQISLPGGAVEAGETVEEAALREAEEEIGLARARVSMRLLLSPLHIPVSGYVLHPVVATTPSPPAVSARQSEVERIVEIELSVLSEGSGLGVEIVTRDGAAIEVPYFDVGDAKLWGATAMVVAELLTVLGKPIDPWPR